eukprot:TRINITY_DN4520_c0_g1_i1.p1 TRINITY_DN4520_c0_g1~~TRINITY_DN4520_c0_g1_i1.p1  ORF type:complete len:173 (-),score=17.92 TRINITY_DN4520_c0_g1_i1:18-476(-)
MNNGICVATTHLKAKVGFEKTRLEQGQYLLNEITKFNSSKFPLIICGDFNDIPESPVCLLFAQNAPIEVDGKTYSHHLPLKSIHSSAPSYYTTYKKREVEVCRTIDYIWYSSDSLTVTHTLSIPLLTELPERLPASYYPSDHLAISCKFELK